MSPVAGSRQTATIRSVRRSPAVTIDAIADASAQ
jgi:hypothetical protein